jgi:basic membrane protein A
MKFFRKSSLAILVAVAALTLSACGSDADEAALGGKVGLAYDIGGRGDKSFNDSAAEGLDRAVAEFGLEAKEVTVTTGSESEREDKLRLLAKAGYNPIIAVGFLYAGPIKTVATDYPNISFAIIDDSSVQMPNVSSLVFAEEQGSYLVGVAAALASKSGKVTSVEFVLLYYRSLRQDSLLALRQQRRLQQLMLSTSLSHLISVVSTIQLRQRLLLRE